MIAEALDIARETYLAFLMDRANNGPVMVGSPMGGMDIEEVAHTHPEALHTVPSLSALVIHRYDTHHYTLSSVHCYDVDSITAISTSYVSIMKYCLAIALGQFCVIH